MKHAGLLAIARIARQGPAGRLSVTTGGDGLRELTPPFSAFLYDPPPAEREGQKLLTPSEEGLDPTGELFAVEVVHVGFSAPGRAGIMINPVPDIVAGIEGCWLCVEHTRLAGRDDLYFYELREFQVLDADTGTELGKIKEFMETAAHGVLVVQTPNDEEVMIPMVDAYVEVDREKKVIGVRNFDDFRA